MDKVKSWVAALTATIASSHVLRRPLAFAAALLALWTALSIVSFFKTSAQQYQSDNLQCPCPLLDGIAKLELDLGHIVSNFSGFETLHTPVTTCTSGESYSAISVHTGGQPQLSIPSCAAFCDHLWDDLKTTNLLIDNLLVAASLCKVNQCNKFLPSYGWLAAGITAALFGLLVVIATAQEKSFSHASTSSGVLDGIYQLYNKGRTQFDEVCSQKQIDFCSDACHAGPAVHAECSELRFAADEFAALEKEVSALRDLDSKVIKLKDERDRLQAAASMVESLEKQNADLAVTAVQLDSVTALNTELRSTVNKVLELRTQNQSLQPIASLLESVSVKHEQLTQAAAQVVDLQNQNQQLQATANLYDNVKATNVSLQQMVAQVMELEAHNQQLRGTASLLELVKAANTELLEVASQVHELQSQNQQLQSTASMLDQARAVNNKLREMVMQVQELQAQNRQLQASASFLHSVKALNIELQDRVIQVQRLQRGTFTSNSPSPKDLSVFRDQESRSSAPQTPTSIITSPRSLESDGGRNRVFIGGLAASVDEQGLASCFDRYGSVIAAKVVRSAKGQQSRGYGFVTFQLPEHADMAVDAVKEMMALLKPKENGMYERLTIDYSTSSHLD